MLATKARVAAPALGRRAASSLALKYSKAVYGAALAKSPATLTKVHTELATVFNAIKQSPQFSTFISNPTLSATERKAGLSAIFTSVEGAKKETISEVTKNLFTVLSENGRLSETEGVIEGFDGLVSQYKGELTVNVTSASPLPKDILTRLESTLKQSQTAQKAKVLKVVNKVNPSVLGGVVIDFGEKSIDLSVQSRVTKLNNILQQSV